MALLLILAWFACGFWNSVKPMPAGTHVTSLPLRLAESQLDFLDDVRRGGLLLRRSLAAVARADLGRLRDSNPLYSGVWRLSLGWWSEPVEEAPGPETLMSRLRQVNAQSDQRQLLVADDGAGGWTSLIASAPLSDGENLLGLVGIEVRGRFAHDVAASELHLAAWSSDDDRLPAAPRIDGRDVGSIDVRFLTEGAIHGAMLDALATAVRGDAIDITVREFGDRPIMAALQQAAARGAVVRLLLDPGFPANQAAAAELLHAGAAVEVRWTGATVARFLLLRHRNDVWLDLGTADHTRRALADLNLEDAIELHLPARAGPVRAATTAFEREWSRAAAYADHADDAPGLYWKYRVAEATGLAMF